VELYHKNKFMSIAFAFFIIEKITSF
jgi:hypothetical protein